MPSPPLDSTQGRTTSGVACYHLFWAAQTVGRRLAWHAITALGQHTWSDNVGRGITSPPLGGTHGQTTSGMACHHRLGAAQTVERRRVWHAITALGQHTQTATSVVACHHSPWTTHTVERRQAWHDITVFGQHTLSNDVGCDMTSSPLGSKNGRMTLSVA